MKELPDHRGLRDAVAACVNDGVPPEMILSAVADEIGRNWSGNVKALLLEVACKL